MLRPCNNFWQERKRLFPHLPTEGLQTGIQARRADTFYPSMYLDAHPPEWLPKMASRILAWRPQTQHSRKGRVIVTSFKETFKWRDLPVITTGILNTISKRPVFSKTTSDKRTHTPWCARWAPEMIICHNKEDRLPGSWSRFPHPFHKYTAQSH